MFIVRLFRSNGNVDQISFPTRPSAIETAQDKFAEVGGGIDKVLVYDPDGQIILEEMKDTQKPRSPVRWQDGVVYDNVTTPGASIERRRR